MKSVPRGTTAAEWAGVQMWAGVQGRPLRRAQVRAAGTGSRARPFADDQTNSQESLAYGPSADGVVA